MIRNKLLKIHVFEIESQKNASLGQVGPCMDATRQLALGSCNLAIACSGFLIPMTGYYLNSISCDLFYITSRIKLQ